MNQVIDRNYYPAKIPQIKRTNLSTRPLGIGVQDLAGCFAMMDYCWDSPEAAELNEKIARVMYYHGMDENVKMAIEYGAYEKFPGSPASKGLFQFDMWAQEKIEKEVMNIPVPDMDLNSPMSVNDFVNGVAQGLTNIFSPHTKPPCNEFDWDSLRSRMMKHGLRFSLLFAQMPTASSAQILGSNESTECYSQLLFSRSVLSGQFIVCVEHLVKDLEDIGLWNTKTLQCLLSNQGSIQSLDDTDLDNSVKTRLIHLKRKYKTAYEHSQKVFADLYLSRARYQCQTSSNNLFMSSPTLKSLNAYHFYMWKGGAKTGMYYLKQNPRTEPLNFTLDSVKVTKREDVKSVPESENNNVTNASIQNESMYTCSGDDVTCLMCGS